MSHVHRNFHQWHHGYVLLSSTALVSDCKKTTSCAGAVCCCQVPESAETCAVWPVMKKELQEQQQSHLLPLPYSLMTHAVHPCRLMQLVGCNDPV